jgi:hypothetical protein
VNQWLSANVLALSCADVRAQCAPVLRAAPAVQHDIGRPCTTDPYSARVAGGGVDVVVVVASVDLIGRFMSKGLNCFF